MVHSVKCDREIALYFQGHYQEIHILNRLSIANQQKSREKVGIKFGKSSEKVEIIGVKK